MLAEFGKLLRAWSDSFATLVRSRWLWLIGALPALAVYVYVAFVAGETLLALVACLAASVLLSRDRDCIGRLSRSPRTVPVLGLLSFLFALVAMICGSLSLLAPSGILMLLAWWYLGQSSEESTELLQAFITAKEGQEGRGDSFTSACAVLIAIGLLLLCPLPQAHGVLEPFGAFANQSAARAAVATMKGLGIWSWFIAGEVQAMSGVVTAQLVAEKAGLELYLALSLVLVAWNRRSLIHACMLIVCTPVMSYLSSTLVFLLLLFMGQSLSTEAASLLSTSIAFLVALLSGFASCFMLDRMVAAILISTQRVRRSARVSVIERLVRWPYCQPNEALFASYVGKIKLGRILRLRWKQATKSRWLKGFLTPVAIHGCLLLCLIIGGQVAWGAVSSIASSVARSDVSQELASVKAPLEVRSMVLLQEGAVKPRPRVSTWTYKWRNLTVFATLRDPSIDYWPVGGTEDREHWSRKHTPLQELGVESWVHPIFGQLYREESMIQSRNLRGLGKGSPVQTWVLELTCESGNELERASLVEFSRMASELGELFGRPTPAAMLAGAEVASGGNFSN